MANIGGKPILWHVMKIFSHYGFNEFVICCGYKGFMIKEYFATYHLHGADVTFDLQHNKAEFHKNVAEPWIVTCAETGEDTMTGGRIKRIAPYIGNEPFFLTYGDGVGDIDIPGLLAFHKKQKTLATVTAVEPPGRFGAIHLGEGENKVSHFREKPVGDGAWISGGFFVCEPEVLSYIENDATVFEQEPMKKLAKDGQLSAFRHTGFWHPMDTLRDKNNLETMWDSGKAPWKVWK
jgi:glucose-1-phosphate cytidylyltransferase